MTVLSLVDSLVVEDKGQATVKLDDSLFLQVNRKSLDYEVMGDKLLALIAMHSMQEPIPRHSIPRLGHDAFVAIASARVQGFSNQQAREEGRKWIGEIKAAFHEIRALQLQRWQAVFGAIERVMARPTSDKAMSVLLLPLDIAEVAAVILLRSPELLAKLEVRTVLTKVHAATTAMPLVDQGNSM